MQFSPSIRCQASFRLGAVKLGETGPARALAVPRETDPCGHRINRNAMVEVTVGGPLGAGSLRGLMWEGAVRSVRLSGCRSFLLALSITKPDPDAGHARLLIQRT